MSGTKFFDPDQCKLLINGIKLEGYAEGSMISWEYSEDRFKKVKGLDGVISRSKVAGIYITLTVHLMNTSRSNAYLTGIHTQDVLSPGGAGVGSLMFLDENGASLIATDEAWIDGFPSGEITDQASPREWKITVVSPKQIEAGV